MTSTTSTVFVGADRPRRLSPVRRRAGALRRMDANAKALNTCVG